MLRQKSLLGETYVEIAPGSRDGPDLPDGGTLPLTHVQRTVQLDDIFSAFDERTRRNFQAWLHESGIATSGTYASDFNDSLGNAAPFFESGAEGPAPARRPGRGPAAARAQHRPGVRRHLRGRAQPARA